MIKYAHPDSAIHSRVIMGTLYSQLIRFVRICNDVKDFIQNAKIAVISFTEKGVDIERLTITLNYFCENNKNLFIKYGLFDRLNIANSIIAKIIQFKQ